METKEKQLKIASFTHTPAQKPSTCPECGSTYLKHDPNEPGIFDCLECKTKMVFYIEYDDPTKMKCVLWKPGELPVEMGEVSPRAGSFASRAIQSEIEDSQELKDQENLRKYFNQMKEVPYMESAKARSRIGEYLDDLQIFLGKWKERFDV